jgi:DnaJ-class molecular chaperone
MKLRLDELIVECEQCGGKGMIREGNERMMNERTCGSCRGEGKRLTEAGKVLQEFITQVTHHQYA